MSMFTKATKQRVFLKVALQGPSGTGKSYSALELAKGLGGKVAAIDTENGSLSLYADRLDFDVVNLDPPYKPEKWVGAIEAAQKAGYQTLIIDSFSHAWQWVLETKDGLDKSSQSRGNSFTNWNQMKKEHRKIVDAILQCKMDVIVTMRAKDAYVIETSDKGKQVPRKVGLDPIAEPGVDFEFTTVWQIDAEHQALATKDRTGLFNNEILPITPDHGKRLLKWRDSGAPLVESIEEPDPPKTEPQREETYKLKLKDGKILTAKMKSSDVPNPVDADQWASIKSQLKEANLADQFAEVGKMVPEKFKSEGATKSSQLTYNLAADLLWATTKEEDNG